jgi:hypothetical protein
VGFLQLLDEVLDEFFLDYDRSLLTFSSFDSFNKTAF